MRCIDGFKKNEKTLYYTFGFKVKESIVSAQNVKTKTLSDFEEQYVCTPWLEQIITALGVHLCS